MEQLILKPVCGMCNRLRAIASGRRLCSRSGAKCSVIWDWADFKQFFVLSPDIEIMDATAFIRNDSVKILQYNGNHVLDAKKPVVHLISSQLFWGPHDSPITTRDIAPFLPALQPRLESLVSGFKEKHLNNAVGFHIRRTDNVTAIKRSPDHLFIEYAKQVIGSGKKIFLATDNNESEKRMKELFGEAIVIYPKRGCHARRWPRAFDVTMMEDDLIDLFLLARTDFVVGCAGSSFSNIAIALNGSENCKILKGHNTNCLSST